MFALQIKTWPDSKFLYSSLYFLEVRRAIKNFREFVFFFIKQIYQHKLPFLPVAVLSELQYWNYWLVPSIKS